MNNVWIGALIFALAGCSSQSDPADLEADAGRGTDTANERDAARAERDARTPIAEEEAREDDPPREVVGERKDAGVRDAAEADAGEVPEVDPRCQRKDAGLDPGPGDVQVADPSIFGPDPIAMGDGVIFTSAGVTYSVPGRGKVYGRQQVGSCVITVAESGVMTTIVGEGTVCVYGRVVAVGGQCTTDAEGNAITP